MMDAVARTAHRLRIVTESSRNASGPPRSEGRGLSLVPTVDLGDASVADLVARAVDGERGAFDELVRRTHANAYGLALRLTGDEEDARDVVQDAYLRAYRSIDRFRGDAQFSTWLYRIVANCAATTTGRRRRHRHEPLPDEALVADPRVDLDPEAHGTAADLRGALEDAIRGLPPKLRAVVVLRDVYELPHDAIADELGISVSAAKVRLHRARRRLREQVYPLPGEDRHAV
jgi:RNA polymerase sigma-70 factor (ECF subfamily)